MNHLPLEMTRWLALEEKERLEYAEALVCANKCLFLDSLHRLQIATKNVAADNERLTKEGFTANKYLPLIIESNDNEFIYATEEHKTRTAEYIAALELANKTLYELTTLIYNRKKHKSRRSHFSV